MQSKNVLIKSKNSLITDPLSRTILPPGQKEDQVSYEDISKILKTDTNERIARPSILKSRENLPKSSDNIKLIDCECGPDLYNKVLGPTADEIFLAGIQTVLNVFGRFSKCDKTVETQPEDSHKRKAAPRVVIDVLESVGLPPEMVSRIITELEQEQPEVASKILQTSTPEMISKILSTVGLDPELVSEIIHTLGITNEQPSMVSVSSQTSHSRLVSKDKHKHDKHDPEKVDKCVCCKCSDDNICLPQRENDIIEKIDNELKSGDHAVEQSKPCICCKCSHVIKDEVHSPMQPIIIKCKSDSNEMKTKRSSLSKLCRCYECSAPVVLHPKKSDDFYICSKPEMKCVCHVSKKKEKICSSIPIVLAKGDTCSLVETSCHCEKKKSFICFRN